MSRGSDIREGPLVSPPLDQHHKFRQPLSEAEERVLALFCSQLHPDWEIYIKPHLNGLRPDFALLNPHSGIAIFEVIELSRLDRRDLTLKHLIQRVHWTKNEIHALYCPRLDRRFGKGLITSGLIFAACDADQGWPELREVLRTTGAYQGPQSPSSFSSDLDKGALDVVFPLNGRRVDDYFSYEMAQDLRCWLEEPELGANIRRPLRLNKRQLQLVTSRTEVGYRRIKGPAGSGKSLVLAARAARLAAEGRNVLVVTYNITLLHYLKGLAESYDFRSTNKVTWIHFHGWCRRIAEMSSLWPEYNEIWGEHKQGDKSLESTLDATVPSLIKEAYKVNGSLPRYDAILVDEGQDFLPDWWEALRLACKPEGEMLLVADSTQDLYGRSAAWTKQAMLGAGFRGKWSELESCYRLPDDALPLLKDFVRRFLSDGVDLNMPESTGQLELGDFCPVTLRWVQASSEGLLSSATKEIARQIEDCDPEILAIPDVTLLVDSKTVGEKLVALLQQREVNVHHTFGSDEESRARKMNFVIAGARVRATTIHSFKGWESRSIIVVVGRGRDLKARSAVYVALTRIKRHTSGSFLTVVCSDPILKSFGRTWPDYEYIEG